MSGAVSRIVRRFHREEKGVVLILFLLLVVPLLLIIAVGIDFGQTLIVKRQLAGAIDAAALAIAKLPTLTDTELNDKAEAFIRAFYPETGIGDLKGFTVTRTGPELNQEIDISATAEVPTTFMKLGGVDKLTVIVNSSVTRKDNNLEVVMVLDNSGSMAGAKLTALKTAANTLVDILFGTDAVSDHIKIGLVPFVAGVNVNVASTTTWLDNGHPAPLNAQIFNNLAAGESAFTVLATMNGGIAANWRGCVRSRYNAGVDNLDTTDTPPDSTSPATLFSAYFVPYLGANKTSYVNQGPTSLNNDGCGVSPIQPLTDTKATITAAINGMVANGSTNIPEALAWGWRVISPGVPFTEGAAYTQKDTIKAIILLTDGDNNAGTFSSYGATIGNPQLGFNSKASLDARTTTVCNNVKADLDGDPTTKDILVYTITFSAPSGAIALMQNCATDAGKFFESPTATALQSAFESIASGLSQLRLTQ